LGALTPAQLAALNGKGVDALNATDNVLTLSVAQLKALGSVGLTADDAVRLADAGTALASLSAGEITGLAARGVDSLDATDNAVTLSLSQYQSLGALQIAAEDRVTVNGTSASERIDGRANNEYLKGFGGNDRLNGNDGNDWLSGGTGKDILTGGRGADVFVFDTRPSKKTNFDTVRDFNVRDDSVYLDNAIFKKLGKGSEANPGKLNKAFFQIGERADDRNDYLIYNNKTGILYYDADGSGSAHQVEIAKLSKNLKLTYKDFFII
jgi:Ca2+-binding RTX toxin-like protein